jgi:hypothetical protein
MSMLWVGYQNVIMVINGKFLVKINENLVKIMWFLTGIGYR